MQKNNFQFQYYTSNTINDFSKEEQKLIQETIKTAKNAYAPYSKFNVSAGVLFDNQNILTATNVENASYPIGICAERNVISYFISNYPNSKIKVLAIYAESEKIKLLKPITPCGMCRQAILEQEERQTDPIKIIMIGANETYVIVESSNNLLPLAFNSDVL
jgi:cytidine deaminase